MTLPKKGSRRIVVDNIAYRWAIRRKPTYNEALGDRNTQAAVELYDNPRSTLLVYFPWVRNDSWMTLTAQPPITPNLIEQCIREAIAGGWSPDEKGGAFQVEYQSV